MRLVRFIGVGLEIGEEVVPRGRNAAIKACMRASWISIRLLQQSTEVVARPQKITGARCHLLDDEYLRTRQLSYLAVRSRNNSDANSSNFVLTGYSSNSQRPEAELL